MLAKWIGDLVGLMHRYGITQMHLAEKLGVTNTYVSMVLKGKRKPKGAKERFTQVVKEMISEQSNYTAYNG